MAHELASVLEQARGALALLLDRTVSLNLWWAGLGLVLYELAQVVRTRGWFNILRATYPSASKLRARDVAGAHLAGSGLNSMLPARAGDLLKLAMIRRRAPEARYSTLAATFIPETIFESLCGTALVIWAFAHGFLPVPLSPGELPQVDASLVITHPLLCVLGAALAVTILIFLSAWLGRRCARFVSRVRHGLAILREPRRFVAGVASWQALSRVIRLAGLACFMRACGLPVTVQTAVLVMASQGAGRIVPLAPVSAGLRVAMLSYGFVEVTDQPVDIASVTSFWFTVGAAHLVASVLLAVAILAVTFRILSPRRAIAGLRMLRLGARGLAPQSDAGPSPLTNEG